MMGRERFSTLPEGMTCVNPFCDRPGCLDHAGRQTGLCAEHLHASVKIGYSVGRINKDEEDGYSGHYPLLHPLGQSL